MLYGSMSLSAPQDDEEAKPGPKPAAIRWKLREITPGAIALAAVLVSPWSKDFLLPLLITISRFDTFYLQTGISNGRERSAISNTRNRTMPTRP